MEDDLSWATCATKAAQCQRSRRSARAVRVIHIGTLLRKCSCAARGWRLTVADGPGVRSPGALQARERPGDLSSLDPTRPARLPRHGWALLAAHLRRSIQIFRGPARCHARGAAVCHLPAGCARRRTPAGRPVPGGCGWRGPLSSPMNCCRWRCAKGWISRPAARSSFTRRRPLEWIRLNFAAQGERWPSKRALRGWDRPSDGWPNAQAGLRPPLTIGRRAAKRVSPSRTGRVRL